MGSQIVGQAFDLEVGHGGGGEFNAAIIPSTPAAFTQWVQENLLATRVSAGCWRKSSRIQDFNRIKACGEHLKLLFIYGPLR
jgi:hypothetical protein